MVCGRRFGKTTLAINELLYYALLKSNSDYWYLAPTYRQAKEIAWRMLKKSFFLLPRELQGEKNESELWVEVGNQSRISLKGADNEDSLRGSPLDGIVNDEVDSIRNFDYLWNEVLSPSLVDRKGWAWFIGTPKGYHNLHMLSERVNTDPEYSYFHFTSYDNPYLEKEEIEKEKNRLTENQFAQEYLADFRKYTGLIYKEFKREFHIVQDVELDGFSAYYRTMDFGAVNPTACLFIKVDRDDNFIVYDEYYETERTTDYHAGQILARHPQTYFRATFGDPSGRQEILDYARWGLHISPANKQVLDKITGKIKSPEEQDWVNYGIEQIQQKLKVNIVTQKPRLFISNKCVNLIREFESYRWEEQRNLDLNAKEVPVKANDHALDALRYFVISYQRPQKKRERTEERVSKITGY